MSERQRMKVYDPKTIKFRDDLAEKRRRILIFKILFFVGMAIAAVGFVLYLFFFSGFLQIKEVSVSGLDKISRDEFINVVGKRMDSRRFGFLEYQKNVIFFDSDAFKAEAISIFPGIRDVAISKKPPHVLDITVTEREIAGVWCFVDGSSDTATENCRYFDKEGNVWGEAAKSSGFLILNVNDNRRWNEGKEVQSGSSQVDLGLLADMTFILDKLKEINIFVKEFTVPENFIGDFRALTSGNYDLIFSTDSDIARQLGVLKIFLTDKHNDHNFKPQYIDLRINGRVYYK